ncbi:hypothetical protein BBO99_00006488 [Phytophthora kernoviae]|uniref:ENTH domain-containing protein n=1 Tax=Phytophthora kernoviae TaxID=325452 RepID=A0A3R7GWX0_9STRA|nr:hypothetical protein BBI17_006549 [Phytophthora kernoviae]RLN77766.1 hypothetical protein BBO99_00006488 [Phytophthora kernoviae]
MDRFALDKLKNVMDEAKSVVKAKMGTDVERKMEEALSNKNWGASSTLLNEISQLTYDYEAYGVVMRKIWEALDAEGRQWRAVYKALSLLEHLIKNGTERVIENARDHMFKLRHLSGFSYHDGTTDRGNGVRDKAKQLMMGPQQQVSFDAFGNNAVSGQAAAPQQFGTFPAAPAQQGFNAFGQQSNTSAPPAPAFNQQQQFGQFGGMQGGMQQPMQGGAHMQNTSQGQMASNPSQSQARTNTAPQEPEKKSNDAWGAGSSLFNLNNLESSSSSTGSGSGNRPGQQQSSSGRDSFSGLDTLAGMPSKPAMGGAGGMNPMGAGMGGMNYGGGMGMAQGGMNMQQPAYGQMQMGGGMPMGGMGGMGGMQPRPMMGGMGMQQPGMMGMQQPGMGMNQGGFGGMSVMQQQQQQQHQQQQQQQQQQRQQQAFSSFGNFS